MEYTLSEKIEVGSSISLPFDELEPGNLSFGLSLTPRESHYDSGICTIILVNA